MIQHTTSRKGIILAGGSGTRLYPLTKVVSKQLMPVYDKPMIFYPLSTLMLAGIREVAIITTPDEQHRFQRLLGDGSQWGIKLEYIAQPSPDGLAQAFILAEDFIGEDDCALILGDNLFYGHKFSRLLQKADQQSGATIFGYRVANPKAYGVIELDENDKALSIEEKPEHPKSNYAATGLYFFDNRVVEFAKSVEPSPRGELEITSVINCYLQEGSLNVAKIGRGSTWLDTGTHQSLLHAAAFIETIESRQGMKIACPEEIAYRMGYINAEQLFEVAEPLRKSGYGEYLLNIIEELEGISWFGKNDLRFA
ncbi:glucose-1-phosphate thymidylyltransferase RfbA [Endozoicomonas euniceicola]|uniref:Glucose-1-phosphate thymidylyltransferase n=1 Tax=Endozoicomonas euniceicola TaxID=1234143 RepID=A0ABY6H2Y9_9GAMM|nr:glucose-1-phosphate thymidylyltransferase RfbA [Endozoicomonas euniceicola]UYM18499.1 glucose-1-phosphate thymidylyltransferase RfbA [Endozoicomonas euniceicola]